MSSSTLVRTDRLEDLPDHFLRCRVYGHAWDQIPPTLADPEYQKLFAWYDVLRCISCATERYDGIVLGGRVDNRSYKYPDGYAVSFTLTRAAARAEYMRRTRTSRAIKERMAL